MNQYVRACSFTLAAEDSTARATASSSVSLTTTRARRANRRGRFKVIDVRGERVTEIFRSNASVHRGPWVCVEIQGGFDSQHALYARYVCCCFVVPEGVMRRRLIIVFLVFAGVLANTVKSAAGEPEVVTGRIMTYAVVPGETLTSIAARFGVDPSTIASDNRLAAGQSLERGRMLIIDNRHIVPATIVAGEIVVNVPQRMLFYREEADVFAYPVAVGRPTWQTPRGAFTVASKTEDPAWHVPASIRAESARKGRELPLVVPPGPRNPLGRFWIGLSLAGIGLHGTPAPTSIYRAATHGCVRLQGDGIEDLYGRVDIGTRGRIIYQPVLIAVKGNEIFLEAHPDVYRRMSMSAAQQARELAVRLAVVDRIDWTVAHSEIERQAGVARRVSFARSQ